MEPRRAYARQVDCLASLWLVDFQNLFWIDTIYIYIYTLKDTHAFTQRDNLNESQKTSFHLAIIVINFENIFRAMRARGTTLIHIYVNLSVKIKKRQKNSWVHYNYKIFVK